jgi:hypothetical protein
VACCRKGSKEDWRGKGVAVSERIEEKSLKKKKNGNKIDLESEARVLLWGAPIQMNAFFRLYQLEISLNGGL